MKFLISLKKKKKKIFCFDQALFSQRHFYNQLRILRTNQEEIFSLSPTTRMIGIIVALMYKNSNYDCNYD